MATMRNSACANEAVTRTAHALMIVQHRHQELFVSVETITLDLVKI